ncbi:MAG: DNA-directed RNA polymerase subunit beta' [Erythrobacter sp.]
MSHHRPSTAAARQTIAALAAPPRIEAFGPYGARFIHALRLIALHERVGRDPVPELTTRLGGVEIAAKSLILAHTISAVWPENIHVSRFCCRLVSHDEATIASIVDAAASADHARFEAAVTGLIRPDRAERLWQGALALIAAERRAL